MSQLLTQYVDQRAEILALTFLTRKQGIFVQKVKLPSVDRLVGIYPLEGDLRQAVRLFGVVLGGTSQDLLNEVQATRLANSKWRHRHDPRPYYFMPILNLLFSMENDQGFYAWNCQPGGASDEHNQPVLHIPDKLRCRKIERTSLDEIIDEIDGWYESLSRVVYKTQ